MARLESQKHQSSIVLYDEHWKKGVIGIVASRLTEIYFRPTVVLTRDENLATGSARSVAGLTYMQLLRAVVPLIKLRWTHLCCWTNHEVGRCKGVS